MQAVLCALMGYLVGGINPSYLFAKQRGFDIRTDGSRNAGASNALITMGARVGILCALFDIAKAYLVVRFAAALFPRLLYAGAIAGTSCILGHIFPILMDFHGGKGFACLGGVVLSYDVGIFLTLLAVEAVLLLWVDYICVVPITGSVAFPIVQLAMGAAVGALIFLPATAAIIYRHMENVDRIRQGIEAHFSYLWRKEDEERRLRKNYYGEE